MSLESKRKSIAVIPARGGSKRIPMKNLKDFLGMPIISYPIKEALKSNLFCKVIVSTDSKEISEIAKRYGAEVPFIRPANLSDDFTATSPVINHAIGYLESKGLDFEYVCCIYPCTPFVKANDLKKVFDELTKKSASYAYPVIKYSHPIQRAISLTTELEPKVFDAKSILKRTQDLTDYYHDAGQFYWARKVSWRKESLMQNASGIAIPFPEWKFIDIDTTDDWSKAELLGQSLNI